MLTCIGFSTFLPTIINDLGKWTAAEVQLLTIPCYFLGAAAYMTTAFLSDKMQRRGLFCVIFGTISVVGYAVLVSDVASGVHYFGCFLVAGGLYVVVGLPLAWVSILCFDEVRNLTDESFSCLETHLGMASEQRRRVCSLLAAMLRVSCRRSSSK